MRPLDAYHGNHHTFWPRLSLRGRHSRRGSASRLLLDAPLPFRAPASSSSGSVSTAANAVENRLSDIGDGALSDSFTPASIYEVAEMLRRRR